MEPDAPLGTWEGNRVGLIVGNLGEMSWEGVGRLTDFLPSLFTWKHVIHPFFCGLVVWCQATLRTIDHCTSQQPVYKNQT